MASLLFISWRNFPSCRQKFGLACKCFVLIKQLYLVKHDFAVKLLRLKLCFLHIVSHLIWWLKICSTVIWKIIKLASVNGCHPMTLTSQGEDTTCHEKWSPDFLILFWWFSTHKLVTKWVYSVYLLELWCRDVVCRV